MINQDGTSSIQTAAQGPSLIIWLGVMAALTICAVAAGAGFGLTFGEMAPKQPQAAARPENATSNTPYGGETAVQKVPPVIANLAGQDAIWVRVQASIVFDRKALHTRYSSGLLGRDLEAVDRRNARAGSDEARTARAV